MSPVRKFTTSVRKRSKPTASTKNIDDLGQSIMECKKCPRLIKYCQGVAHEKRRQFMAETYWGRPVAGFGDVNAKILIVGLAPAAHGANRTGRMFTGDQSGLWLYRTLHQAGLSNRPESLTRDDSLKLKDAYITAIVRCAPPQNKPETNEILRCSAYLRAEINQLKKVKVFICLGQIAFQNLWKQLPEESKIDVLKPKFAHGLEIKLNDGSAIVTSYHPSQQNTFTKKLTRPMFESVFKKAKTLAMISEA